MSICDSSSITAFKTQKKKRIEYIFDETMKRLQAREYNASQLILMLYSLKSKVYPDSLKSLNSIL